MSRGERREPGERYFAALDRDRAERERVAEEAERAYARDVGVVRVISMVPPLLYCTSMIAGAASEDVSLFVLRYVLGPLGVVATAFVIWLILKYERSPRRDFGVPVVVFGAALLNGLTGFATGSVVYVLVPLLAPLTQWALPTLRTLPKARRRD
ncbi:hypothetical protein [Streptomyces venezuelae]|uniref:Uncharacterized protein n=1 Tax=Streptomyces venezuelae TaxID=54571 RepID=A0A5P2BX44_STRVZ|nr:hypothetical protein [Streptomyces venezuelae]QES34797.1 hypothetical protein DEJ48_16540 [Streptomyces venezuelae]